ncbi:MAG: hypothetical protein QXJ50_04705 [Candidatus Woesearchaeota archaeon]
MRTSLVLIITHIPYIIIAAFMLLSLHKLKFAVNKIERRLTKKSKNKK